MYRFLETIRVDHGRPLHLAFHQARVTATAAAHGYPALELAETVSALLKVDVSPGGVLTPGSVARQKLRIVYELSTGGPAVLQHEVFPYSIRPIHMLVCIEAPSLRYEFKYADRSQIDSFQPTGAESKPTAAETEPLFLRNGYLSDSRYANLVLREPGGRLFTPEQPLLAGTARARLLAAGLLHTAPIHVSDLPHFQSICLINAMLDLGDCELPISAVHPVR